MAESLSPEVYSAVLIDHFQNPRNAGAMDDADAEAYVTNPVCGDSLRLFLKFAVPEDGDESQGGKPRIERASFLSSGCPASIATSSAATEMVVGLTAAEAAALGRDDYAEAVGGLPRAKVHCSVLAAAAVTQAVEAYRARAGSGQP
ncbi:MAG: iron-sulfur cluster assembly scaffold protein [Dehalococcoidia bacterium]|nr:iron-sulfur cluster assembly scaffold protein [Dehalococcoidia bacterium]